MNISSCLTSSGGSSLLAELTHELRTHLNGVVGMSELLLGTHLTPEQRRYAGALTQAGRQLRSLTQDILDIARIENGQLRLEQGEFDPALCIEDVLTDLAERAQLKGLELIGDLPAELPGRVRGDRARFGQMLTYLVEHLLDQAREGEIMVRASSAERERDQVCLRIEIAASGLDPVGAHHAAGVDALLQGEAATCDRSAAALGLSIARSLVRLMGGAMGCQPDSSGRARTWIALPLEVTRWDAPATRPWDGAGGRRALLVAPPGWQGEVMAVQIRALGWEVLLRVEANAALVAARASLEAGEPFDALVVDARVKGLESLLSPLAIRREAALARVARILLAPVHAKWRDDQAAALDITAMLPKPARRVQLRDCLADPANWRGPEPVSPVAGETAEDGVPSRTLGLKVLVVDDNAINRETIAAMLGVLGCEARLAFDGRAAIAARARESFDLILMDCKMPRMDGYEATRRLRLQESGDPTTATPIIALTAHAMEGDAARCRAVGMDDYLTKPVSLGALRAALQRWSRQSGRGRQWHREADTEGVAGACPGDAPGEGPAELAGLGDWPILDAASLDEIQALSPESGALLVDRLVHEFLSAAPVLASNLREALDMGLSRQRVDAARSLYLASATLGAARLAELCGRLERMPEGRLTADVVGQATLVLESILTETLQVARWRCGGSTAVAIPACESRPPGMELAFGPVMDGAPGPWDGPPAATCEAGVHDEPSGLETRPLVLLVDDDPAMHVQARSVFDRQGFRFSGALAGRQALEMVHAQRPHLVMLELMLPDLDGCEVCRQLRARPGLALVPILMVSAQDDPSAIERAYESGATDFLVKPVNWPLLGHRIRHLIGGYATLAALHRSEASHSALLAAIPDALMRLDAQGRVLQFKAGLLAPDLFAEVDSVTSDLSDLFPAAVCALMRREIAATLAEQGLRSFELDLADGRGDPLACDARLIAIDADQVILLLRDVSERQRRQQVIEQLAYRDSLTGLANRRQFDLDLANALARARRREDRVALLYLDLDRFKRINDSLGHGVGDELLRAAARRVADVVDEVAASLGAGGLSLAGTLARLGGDELAVILKGAGIDRGAMRVAEHTLAKFREPFPCSDHAIVCTVSLGVALSPEDGETPELLLRHADTALSVAKRNGRDTYRFFTPAMGERASCRLGVEARLRLALERDEFRLHYQPILDARSRALLGLEALLRWEDPERGLLEPGDFLAVAGEAGLMPPIGVWAIEELARQLTDWSRLGRAVPAVAINLADVQFGDRGLTERLFRLARGRPPGTIELEIAESLLLARDARLLDALNQLRDKGVRVAIDNFGTGYSSLALLRHLPIDVLKIDRAFVREIGREPAAELLIRTIIAMANGLGLGLVAKGVETEQQLDFLAREGCHAAQGFLLAMPMPADQLTLEAARRG